MGDILTYLDTEANMFVPQKTLSKLLYMFK